jgi:hypothetical protein
MNNSNHVNNSDNDVSECDPWRISDYAFNRSIIGEYYSSKTFFI